jgi:hypothetical protein
MRRHYSKRKKATITVFIILAVVVAVRLVLPYVVLHYANKTLANMDGYRGHIKDIDLALIRGAYKIDSLYLHKVDSVSKKETPFLAASVIDLSVEWRALFKGSIVGEVIIDQPLIRFTKEKVEPKDVQKDSTDFKKVLDEFMPLEINRLEFRNGTLQYIDDTSKPPVNIRMTDMYVVALNLRNSYDSAAVLPASVTADAKVYEGTFNLKMKLNPLAEQPTFDLNAEWKKTNLVKLNDFFQAYAKIDINKGRFGLYTEVAAKEGEFTGYVKPLLEDIDVLGKEDRKDNILRKLWEGVSGTVSEIFENQSKETFATKIPFKGRLDDPKVNIWQAIIQILQNAFVQALQPSIDQQINLAAVDKEQEEKKGFLEKIFGKKDDDDDKKDEKKDKRKKG